MLFIPFTFLLDENQFFQNVDKPPFLTEAIKVVGDGTGRPSTIERDGVIAEKANLLYQSEKYQGAIRHLDELIRRNPYDKNLYLMRGNAHYQLGHQEQACADFAKVRDFLGQDLPPASVAMCR